MRLIGKARPDRREIVSVVAIMTLGIVIRVLYVVLTSDHRLAGDEIEYGVEGRFAAAGKFLWSSAVVGSPHESFWKAPGYAAWLGGVYNITGTDPDHALLAQAALLSPLTILLTWVLGRRLFAPNVGVAAALLVAVYPNAWQFDVRLYSEALATPLTLALLIAVLTAERVSAARAAAVGGALGLLLLIKPSNVVLVAPIGVAWFALAGRRTGIARLALTFVATVIVLTPWAIRNHRLDGEHFVPISVQSVAAYGVFNSDAANDRALPWAWRPLPSRDRELLSQHLTEGELYVELRSRIRTYILDHPLSVPKAFYWNGLRRLWDLRSPHEVLSEVIPQGRTRGVATVGLAMYWPLLGLAAIALWRVWHARRRWLVVAVAATALAASVVYTANAFTRYRAPLEPVIVILAMSVVVGWRQRAT